MKHLLSAVVLGLAIIIAAKITTQPVQPAMITVTGQAEMDTLPQLAHFSATVSEFNADKETAVNQVNAAMDKLIVAVKTFGIADADITTQQVSVYELDGGPEIMIYPPRPRAESRGWQASNSIEITLRDIEKASALTDLLQGSGATSVNGPNFTMDDTADLEIQLLTEAIADAREKAQTTASAAGRRLGKVITVSESGNVMPLYYRGMEAVGSADVGVPAPIEPGTQTTSKTVTVVFELK